RDVVTNEVVDRPAALAALPQNRLAQSSVDAIVLAQVGIFARAADVEDVHLVPPRAQLRGKMRIRERPEGGVQSEAVTEHHRQLARVRVLGPTMSNAEPPAIGRVGIPVRAGAQVRTWRLAAHGGTARESG